MPDAIHGAVLVIVTAIGTLVVKYIVARFAQHDEKAFLQATVLELQKRVGRLESENSELKAENAKHKYT